MSKSPATISKHPTLTRAQDYYQLRREGIGFVEQMSSQVWTDYNTHDPGITILEVLCYVLTDLAYKAGWDIKDILAPSTPPADLTQPFPNQAFFTPREILTVNPWTPEDFRRLLIDLEMVRNGWVFCKKCGCDTSFFAWCDTDKLVLSYAKPDAEKRGLEIKKVEPAGLYDVLLELESDAEHGDLNDQKVEYSFHIFGDEDAAHLVRLELRFPQWELANREQYQLFLSNDADSTITVVARVGATRQYDIFEELREEGKQDEYLRNHWRNAFYVDFQATLANGKEITINDATLRIFGNATARHTITAQAVRKLLEDTSRDGFIRRYRAKLLKREEALASAKAILRSHRNLDEDYCRVGLVAVEEVAVCADVEVTVEADIDRVQAQIWLELEQYFNPPVHFYSLQELMGSNVPVEEIFNGPELNNGFIKTEDLRAAGLKRLLRTSDIINRLMDIEGVVAINNLLLSKYDEKGSLVSGAAADATVDSDANKTSASWLVHISELHQPRLYRNQSRFLFYKKGLPFLPRMDEARDTLTQLRGAVERPKINNGINDLAIPQGNFRSPEDYFPVQYSFPPTYGIGPEGLPSHASNERRAQARQLKAYLMVFEQLLGNAFAQIAHVGDLFSIDPAVPATYFAKELSETLIQGYAEIVDGLDRVVLQGMVETTPEFLERRNRFLDHILARFGEQFADYALLLTNLQGEQVALDQLIEDKIFFLKAYPLISHDRARGFNYTERPCSPDNSSGLKRRVSLLLGYPHLSFQWTVGEPEPESESESGNYTAAYQLRDMSGKNWFEGELQIDSGDPHTVTQKAFRQIIVQLGQSRAYEITDGTDAFRLKLKGKEPQELGQSPELFKSKSEAEKVREELLRWSSNERGIVVEHLLLRPKFPGDALYPVCAEGACLTCGNEDPYSFRLTFVLPGWTEPYNVNMDMRRFAERTIRHETPSHLLGKTCWVGNDGFIENLCEPIISHLSDVLIANGKNETEGCHCASDIYAFFSKAFGAWYSSRMLVYFHYDALLAALDQEFSSIGQSAITCAAGLNDDTWREIHRLMLRYFHHVALYGWQFERFEDAWCKWLDANAAFDWTEERLQERLHAMLTSSLKTDIVKGSKKEKELCKCAASILTKYGTAFYAWMDINMKQGNLFEEFTAFPTGEDGEQITLCPGFSFHDGTSDLIKNFLTDRYSAYKNVSYRLRVVVDMLARLRNTYPGATLHDCDDGSDENPVRLGSTALGNYPLRRTLRRPTG